MLVEREGSGRQRDFGKSGGRVQSGHLMRKVFLHAAQRVGRGLPEAANGRIGQVVTGIRRRCFMLRRQWRNTFLHMSMRYEKNSCLRPWVLHISAI